VGAALIYARLVGVGGIGSGLFFALEGDHDLGRNESRPARRLDVRDYGKLHIIAHYPSVLLRAHASGSPFHVAPVGRVGVDEAGETLRQEMTAAGMDLRFVLAVTGRPTQLSVCFQYPDGSGGNITTSDSAADTLTPADVDAVSSLIDRRTIVLAAPEVSFAVRRRLLELGTEAGALRVASFVPDELRGPEGRALLALADVVSLNQEEAAVLAGRSFPPEDTDSFLDAVGKAVSAAQSDIALIVTAGVRGAFAWARGERHHVPAMKLPVASTAGAGDALLGGVISGLAVGLPFFSSSSGSPTERPLESALDLGVFLASYAVTSPHTIPAKLGRGSLRDFAGRLGLSFAPGLDPVLAEGA
jgi:sugar/nucleoside kinase (ribokinase family)